MKTTPIIMNSDMVRALLDGRKTQTRRALKKQPHGSGSWVRHSNNWVFPQVNPYVDIKCPFGQPDDLLWVRETFSPIYPQDPNYNGGRPIEYDYKASYQHGNRMGDLIGDRKKWTPSIHMPRWASRLTLKITDVRVERLQEISEFDARDEGVEGITFEHGRFWRNYTLTDDEASCSPMLDDAAESYRSLWKSIYGDDSWEENPWVWVIEFEVINGNVDDVMRGAS